VEGLTTGELVAAAKAKGYRVSSSQLERWRQAGLIPGARRRGRGKGAGVSWRHPEAAKDQLLVLLEIRRPREPLSELAIRLWLRSLDVPMPKVKEHLEHIVSIFPRLRKRVGELGIVGFGEKFADMLQRTPKKRSTYGIEVFDENGYDQAREVGEAVAAQFTLAAAPTEEHLAAIELALKVRPSERSIIAALGANLKEEIHGALPLLSSGDRTVLTASDGDLLTARELWARTHALDFAARGLPLDHPLRDILLRMADGHDSGFGLVLMTIIVQSVRAAGIADPVERFDAAFRPVEAT
jgi:hypothetical protein